MDKIAVIIQHYETSLIANPEKADTLKTRVADVSNKQIVTLYYTPKQDRMILLGKSGTYTQRIGSWFDCDCHSFMCSGKGHENKTPCKHLIALALWGLQNLRAI